MKKLIWIIPLCAAGVIGIVVLVRWLSAPCTDAFSQAVFGGASSAVSHSQFGGPTQSELNAKIKSDAINVDINSYKTVPADTHVTATGTVENFSSNNKFYFTLTENSDRGAGVFEIMNLSGEYDFKNGDTLQVWGTFGTGGIVVDPKTGLPQISAIVVEKQ